VIGRFIIHRVTAPTLAALLCGSGFISAAQAQQAGTLPQIEVSPPAATPKQTQKPKRGKQSQARPKPAPANEPAAAAPSSINDDASRIVEVNTIVGASTSVITAEDIKRSPGQTVQDVLGTIPGVQLQSLYGGVNGAGTTVDLRGFGAFATSNTLFLLNGRRLNDADLQGVDLSTIPLQSIERIEVTRGNSAAVLYGDNAVGGVVNIITKTGVDNGKSVSGRVEGGIGSFNQRFGSVSATTNAGPWSTSVFANAIKSDGYRQNNALEQQNGIGELRYTTPDLKAYFSVTGDNQRLGLPGSRSNHYTPDFGTTYINQLGDLRGTSTPFDYANKQGVSATTGFTKSFSNSVDLIVDGGVRSKKQQAGFLGDPASPFPSPSYVDSDLLTWSLTPRLNIRSTSFGMPSTILTGVDYYDANYKSSRSDLINDPPNHVYNLDQKTLAGYWQQTLGIWQGTDFSYGGRLQYMNLSARDNYDALAPSGSLLAQATPLDQNETNHALHIGLEHRLNDAVTIFGRAAQSFRTPNVDERIVTGPAFLSVPPFTPIPQNFDLKTQTSHDAEGGVRLHLGRLDLQSSVYDMHLKNEIHFDPVNFFNYNLDPTHRYGSETNATYALSDSFRLKGSFAYTRAVFSEGQFAGNDVPLVSRYSGSTGLSWNIWQRYAMFDATWRFWGPRRFDNDQLNQQPLIPSNSTIDLKLSGELDRYYWAAAITNVFSTPYYDYGVASASTPGVITFYPLPGRVYTLKMGATF
jgi:iron complex outermembrane receptor protein